MDETERELLLRSRQERLAIVAKYDKGREPGAQIDDWEDPKNELYHTQDRFGFIQWVILMGAKRVYTGLKWSKMA